MASSLRGLFPESITLNINSGSGMGSSKTIVNGSNPVLASLIVHDFF